MAQLECDTPKSMPIACGAIGAALGSIVGMCTSCQLYVIYGGTALGCIAGWVICLRHTPPIETVDTGEEKN